MEIHRKPVTFFAKKTHRFHSRHGPLNQSIDFLATQNPPKNPLIQTWINGPCESQALEDVAVGQHTIFPQYRIHGFVWTYSKHPMVHHSPDQSCHVGVIVYISSHMNIPWNSVIVDLFGLLTKLMYHCFDFKSVDPKYQPLFNNPKWKCITSHSPLFFFMCWFYGW